MEIFASSLIAIQEAPGHWTAAPSLIKVDKIGQNKQTFLHAKNI